MGWYRKSKLAFDTFRTLTSKNGQKNTLNSSQLGLNKVQNPQFSLSSPISRSNLGFFQLGLKQYQNRQFSRANSGFFQLGIKNIRNPQISRSNLGFSQLGLKQSQNPQIKSGNLGFSQLGTRKNRIPQILRSNLGFSRLGVKQSQNPQIKSGNLGFLQLGIRNIQNPQIFTTGARRYYYVDRYQVHHFRPRGPRKWFQNPRTVLTVVLIGSGVVITVYFGNLETVPYTKRKHFVLLSKQLERQIGQTQFNQIKGSFKGKILPAIHPESIRVRLIAKDIIEALQRGLRHEQAWSDMGYGAEGGWGGEGESEAVILALSETGEGKWHKEDEVLDDSWVNESRKKGLKPNTSHMEGLNWEVIVVNEPVVNAFCLPGGKIVVFTGLLEHFRSDAEVATIIGHEVGHAVARHAAEGITKNLWFAILQLVLYQFVMPDIVNTMSTLFLRLPFSRRMEMEADYIGLLLIASAGYDPRVAPQVYEKLGKITGESALRDYLSTHPSGKKRAQLLAQAQVMEEAMSIYREVVAGKGVEGFL